MQVESVHHLSEGYNSPNAYFFYSQDSSPKTWRNHVSREVDINYIDLHLLYKVDAFNLQTHKLSIKYFTRYKNPPKSYTIDR